MFNYARLLRCAGFAFALILSAVRADALTEDIIELQLDAVQFGGLIRQAVIDRAPCPTRLSCFGDELGPDVLGSTHPCYIDHIDVPDEGTFRFASETESIAVGLGSIVTNVSPMQFVQPTTVYAKSEECIFDANCEVNDYVHTVDAALVLGFDLVFLPDLLEELNLAGPAVCANLEDVEGGVTDKERALLLVALQEPICQELPTTSIAALSGGRPVIRAGITLAFDLDDLAVRVEFDASGPDQEKAFDESGWRNFLGGVLAPTRLNRGLGLMVQKDVLINTFTEQLDPTSDSGLNSDGQMTSNWIPRGTAGATLELTSPVEVIIPVCPDIDTDITFILDFTFDSRAGQMVVDVLIETDMSFWDKLACGLMFGGGASPFDALLREALIQILADVFTPTTQDKIDESEAARKAGKEGKIPEECVATGSNGIRCLFDVELETISFGGIASGPQNVRSMFGHADGLMLLGSFRALRLYDPWFLETNEIPIQWSISNSSCYSGGESESFAGQVGIGGRGRLCEAPIYHDDYGVYHVEEKVSGMAMPKEWIVHVSDFYFDGSSDWQAPYDFEMTVFTTVGSQTIALDAPSYSASDAASAELELSIETEIDCTTYAPDGLDNLSGFENPETLINPDPTDQVLAPIEETSIVTSPTSTSTTTTTTTTASPTTSSTSFSSGLRLR